MPDCRTPEEFLLGTLTAALEQHGLGANVGLLLPDVFTRHRGGIGILVGFPDSERAAGCSAAEWLLKEMGCEWVRDHSIGVEAHLCGKLRPVPELPPRKVTSADTCQAAETAVAPEPGKRCTGCGQVKPVTAFDWRNRAKGWRMPMCPPCDHARNKRWQDAGRVTKSLAT